MGRVIDDRVVQMEFDNQQFEKNIKQSMDSLNKLDSSLNTLGKSDSSSAITNSLNKIKDALSNINPTRWTWISEINKDIKKLGTTLVTKLLTPINQIKSGGLTRALNIENAKFQFRGLGMDVEKAMESANKAVADTAYTLDAAAVVASQLGASGVEAGDEMTKALTAVSGVAAMTNSSYEEIGHIFTQVAGQGRLMGQQLTMLSMRGMNAAAIIGQSLGKTEADVRKLASQGKISFKQFYEAMYDAFGEHAYKANETYAGSLENVQAALSKIGADFAQWHLSNMTDIFNSLRLAINKVRKELTPFSNTFRDVSAMITKFLTIKIDSFNAEPLRYVLEGICNILIFAVDLIDVFRQAIKEMIPSESIRSFESIALAFRDFTERLQLTSQGLQDFKDIVKGFMAFLDIFRTIIIQIFDAIVPGTDSLGAVFTIIVKIFAALGRGIVVLDEWIRKNQVITKVIDYLKIALVVLISIIATVIIKIQELVNRIRSSEVVIKIISTINFYLEKFKQYVKEIVEILNSSGGDGKGKEGGGFAEKLKKFGQACQKVVGEITPLKVSIAMLVGLLTAFAVAMVIAYNKIANGISNVGKSFNYFATILKNYKKDVKALEDTAKKIKRTKVFLTLIVIIGEITALVFALKGLASQPISSIAATLATVGILMTEMWMMIRNIADMPDPKKAQKNLKLLEGVALAIAAIGFALNKASEHNWKQIGAAGVSMGIALLAVIGVLKVLSTVDAPKLSKMIDTIAKMSVIMMSFPTIARALNSLRDYSDVWYDILINSAAISGCLMAIAGFTKILAEIDMSKINIKKIALVGALCLGMSLIGSGLGKAAQQPWENVLISSVAITGSMYALAGVIEILTKIKNIEKAIAASVALAIASLSFISLAEALSEVSFYNWDDMWQTIISISVVVTVLGGVLAALTALGETYNGLGAVIMIGVAAALFIMYEALKQFAEGVMIAAQAMVVMTEQVDFDYVVTGLMKIEGLIANFPTLTLIGIGLAAAIGGKGIYYIAEALEKACQIDTTTLAESIRVIIQTLSDSSENFVTLGASLGALGLGLQQIALALQVAGWAMVPLGLGLTLAGVGVLAVAGALRLAAPALEQMQTLDWVTISEGFVLTADALGDFVVPCILLGLAGKGLVKAALSLAGLAIECWAFQQLDLETIAKGLQSVAISGAEIGAAGLLMIAGAVGVGAMALAVFGLGQAVASAAVLIDNGIKLIVNDFKMLYTIGTQAVQGFLNGIADKLPEVSKIGTLLGSLFSGSLASFLQIASPSKLVRFIGDMTGSGFILGIADKMDQAEASGESLGSAAVNGILENSDFARMAGEYLGIDFSNGFNGVIDSLFGYGKNYSRTGGGGMPSNVADKLSTSGGNGLENRIKNFFGDMFDLDDITGKFGETAAGAAGGVSELSDSMGKAGKSAKEAKNEISSFVEKIEGSFNILDEFDLGLDEENPLTADKLLSNMRSNIEGMAKWSNEMESLSGKVAQGLYKKLADLGPQGYKYVHAFTEMTKEQLEQVNTYYATSLLIPTNVTTQIYRGMNDAANNAYTGFVNGLHIPEYQQLGIDLATGFLDGMTAQEGLDTHSPSKKTYAIGGDATRGLAKGIDNPSAKESLMYNISKISREIIEKFRKGLSADNFKDIGLQISRGLKLGIEQGEGDAVSAINKVCDAVKSAAKSKKNLDERSPSHVFEAIGKYIDEGLALGITKNVDEVENAVNYMSNAAIDNMRDAIAMIETVTDADLNVEPVIRPVVDLSNIQNGANTISSLMANNFGSNVTMPRASFMTSSELISNTDNTNIVNAVNSLQEDVRSLKGTISNIKMVLDTGTMVGAMTPMIDQELYTRQVYAGRGI